MTDMMVIFLIALFGYALGNAKFAGIQLGTSGVLLVALVFGHFGFGVPSVVRDFGLVCFVSSVGFIAGPVFFRNFKSKAFSYIVIGILVIVVGFLVTTGAIKLFGIPKSLAVGMFTGALTSTPGLAAAIEATGDSMASIGYGIAYPFGVVGVVLFVQLIPKFVKADMSQEVLKLSVGTNMDEKKSALSNNNLHNIDGSGMLSYAAAVMLGLLMASFTLKLPGGVRFNLGTSGGPLLSGLLFGHFGRVGQFSIKVPVKTLETLRELGLMLFLMGAGTNAGEGFVEVLKQYGLGLFFMGAFITLIPMIIGYSVARYLLKLELLNCLGSICGGMTSTPALGTLIAVSGTENVAASYAATYPVALIFVVVASQIISLLL